MVMEKNTNRVAAGKAREAGMTEEQREARSAKLREAWKHRERSNPKLSEKMKKLWADPEWRKKRKDGFQFDPQFRAVIEREWQKKLDKMKEDKDNG